MPLSQIQLQAILYTRLGESEHLTPLIEQDSELLECRDEDNNTLLLIALKYHHHALAEQLLQMGAKLNVANTKRMTPLDYAIKRGYFELARTMLLQPNGVRVNETNTKGESALMLLAQKGCLETLECIKSKYPDVSLKNHKGQTAFAIALNFHQFDFADALLHYRADINAKDNDGNTALHTAVTIQDIAAIEFLTSRGAAIRINNKEQLSPIDIVANQGVIELTALLRSCDKRDSSNELSLFLWAASRGYVGILKSLLNEESSQTIVQIPSAPLVEVQSSELGFAETFNASVVASPVLQEPLKAYSLDKSNESGANAAHAQIVNASYVNAQRLQTLIHQINDEGDTGLFLAIKHKQEKVVELLLSHHAEINVFNYQGKTPLMLAVENYYAGLVRILIQGGADLSLCNAQGLTAARMAFNLESSQCALEFYRHIRALGQKIDEDNINEQERKILSEIQAKHYIENPLIAAAQNQNEKEVERLLNIGADVTDMDKQGQSALYHAVSSRSLPIVKLLVQHGANVNAKTKQNDTAIMVAARQGHVELVEFLINSKANLGIEHSDGTTALEMALHHNQMIIAEMIATRLVLLGQKIPTFKYQANKKKAQMIIERDYPIGLMDAAKTGDVTKATMLLEQGAFIDVRNSNGETPLHKACQYGHLDMISFLISCDADPTLLNLKRFGLVHYAAAYDQVDVLTHLEQYNMTVSTVNEPNASQLQYQPIHLAAQNGAEQALRYILAKAPEQVYAVGFEGDTPLHLAASHGHTSCCRVLVWYGASLIAEDANKRKPLVRALLHDRDETSDYLYDTMIELGIELPKNKQNDIPYKLGKVAKRSHAENLLLKSAKENDLDSVAKLIEKGAVVSFQDEANRTALFYALENKNHQMVQLLKDSGADLNEKDPQGLTYAMYAARDGDLPYLKYLVSIGASVLVECGSGNIPLFYAIHNLHSEVVSYLLEIAPQSVLHVNKEGWTAVFFAACTLQHDMITKFIALGARENIVNIHGQTLLLHAAANGLVEMLKERIAQGDGLLVVDRQNKSALHLALEAKEYSLACCKYLILAMNRKKNEIPIYLKSNAQIKKIESDLNDFKMYYLSNYRNGARLDAILKFSKIELPDTVLDEQDKANIYNQVNSRLQMLFATNASIVSHIDNQLTKLGAQNKVTINVLMVLDKLMLELESKNSELSSEIIELALLKEAKNINSELHTAFKGSTSLSFFTNSKGRNRSLSLEKVVSTMTTNALKENVQTLAITGTSNFSLLGEGRITDEALKQNLLEKLRLDFSNAQHREFWASKVKGSGGVLCEGVRVPKTISKLREHVSTFSTANYASLLSSLKEILREEDQKAKIGRFFSSKGLMRSDEVNRLIKECENLEWIDFSVESACLRSPSV